jgi:hypothetical protein
MVASYMLKTLLPVAVLTSYAAAETCDGGEWDVIVVGKFASAPTARLQG